MLLCVFPEAYLVNSAHWWRYNFADKNLVSKSRSNGNAYILDDRVNMQNFARAEHDCIDMTVRSHNIGENILLFR